MSLGGPLADIVARLLCLPMSLSRRSVSSAVEFMKDVFILWVREDLVSMPIGFLLKMENS